MRVVVLDGFRGLFLLLMTFGHLSREFFPVASNFTHRGFGWADVAQGFLFVSGIVVGTVYTRKLRRTGGIRIGPRVATIWYYHLGVIALALAGALVLRGIQGGADVGLPAPFDSFGTMPVLAGGLAALLLTGPTYIGILPMYVVFMLLTPPALRAIEKGHARPVLAVSVLTWVAAQSGIVQPAIALLGEQSGLAGQGIRLGFFFNFLGWQLLYFTGVVLGALAVRGDLDLSGLRASCWRPVFWICLASVVVFALLKVGFEGLGGIPLKSTSRSDMSILNIANFAVDAFVLTYLLVVGATAGSGFVRRAGMAVRWLVTWAPLRLLGRHSLEVYAFHVVLVYGAAFAAHLTGGTEGQHRPALLLLTLLLFVPAVLLEQRRGNRGRVAPLKMPPT